MNKVLIRRNEQTATGYELVTIYEDGTENVKELTQWVKNDPDALILPENDSNRKYFTVTKMRDDETEYELTYKASRTLGPSTRSNEPRSINRFGMENYLTEDELIVYNELKQKAMKRKEIAEKRALLEQYQRELKKLMEDAE